MIKNTIKNIYRQIRLVNNSLFKAGVNFNTIHARIKFIILFILLIGFIYSSKLIYSTLFSSEGDKSRAKFSKQLLDNKKIKKTRGCIYDRNGILLASSVPMASVAINPSKVIDQKLTAKQLCQIFPELKYDILLRQMSPLKKFVWIKRGISPHEEKKLLEVGVPALIFEDDKTRIYPSVNTAAFTVGYVDVDQNGQAGIERTFNEELSNGDDVHLSIDIRLQDAMRSALIENIKKLNAEGGLAVILNVKTNEILSLVSLPDFNPHYPTKHSSDELFNRVSLGVYELGSVFKAITIAAALDSRSIKASDTFPVYGPMRIGKHSINNFSPMHVESANAEVILAKSCNTGTIRIANQMGVNTHYEYFQKFGLLGKIDFGLIESARNLIPKMPWSDVTAATISFGHGFAVTPMHLVSSFSTLVNGGYKCPITIVKLLNNKQVICDQVLKNETSELMRYLLRQTVATGCARRADGKPGDLENFCIGGKTGTASKLKNGRYSKQESFTSFIGAFPMYDPKYVILVSIDNPKGDRNQTTGGMASAPVVYEIVKTIAPIINLNVEPERCFFKVK